VSLIFITHAHFDHYGNAGAIRGATGAPIAIHPLDREAMARGQTPIPERRGWGHLGPPLLWLAQRVYAPLRTETDRTLGDGDRLDEFGIDAVVIHTPGHTRGSCSLLVEKRLLFVGDLIIARPWIHKQSYYAEDWQAIDESIAKVKTLSPERTYPGHGSRALSRERLLRVKGSESAVDR
jgi:glyoxylase-like metal-dependent hydrolase (beta-lactamase superfamily II)